MRKTKGFISVILCIAMIALLFVPVMAEVDTETCSHQWRWVTDVAATCGDDGVQHQICVLCSATRNENTPLPATGNHDLEWILDAAPTCGQTGIEHQYCNLCHHTYNEGTLISATGEHTWAWVVDTAPTCGEAGSQHRECTVCGQPDPYTAGTVIQATGKHKWIEGDVISESTCIVHGQREDTCEYCGGTRLFELELAEHTWDEGYVSLEPGCAEKGYMVYTCTVEGCNAQKSVVIPATGNHVDADGNGQCDVCGVSMPATVSSGTTLWNIIQSVIDFFTMLYNRIAALFS
ncbi:MAG: hypothetical protein IJS90_07905 [Clostridia bacterium]|nr:hypothetical protein [Clostridia bacterium]